MKHTTEELNPMTEAIREWKANQNAFTPYDVQIFCDGYKAALKASEQREAELVGALEEIGEDVQFRRGYMLPSNTADLAKQALKAHKSAEGS